MLQNCFYLHMKFFSADIIITCSSAPVKGGIVVTDDEGRITEILNNRQQLGLDTEVAEYHGLICPGFVNTHCHLELSHLISQVPAGTGLQGFIRELIRLRNSDEYKILDAARNADRQMYESGVIAVGDISNTTASLEVKKNSKIHYHTFIELFDLHESRAESLLDEGLALLQTYQSNGLEASIVPHAPYTVSSKLLKLISNHAYAEGSLLTIHNQESQYENEMFQSGTGELITALRDIAPDLYYDWHHTGFNSLASVFALLPKCNKIAFVHNTYSSQEDVKWAQLYSMLVWWCFCPKANMHIEGKLPDIPMIRNLSRNICIGTDSLASNDKLSMVDEIKCIQDNYPDILLEEIISWSCLGGAEFLGIHREFGTLEKGKRPGLVLIEGLDLYSMKSMNGMKSSRII